MSKILFEPGSPTFNELIGNGKINVVPKFQRDYSWDIEEWDDLWTDIEGIPDEGVHYMGYVVLQRTDDSRTYIIIDGQQRITTLSILALSVIKLLNSWVENNIESEDNKRRMEILTNQFIGFTSASSLTPVSKLRLNRNNDDFYKSYLLRNRKPVSLTKLKPSERKLWKAHEFFYEKLKEKFENNKKGSEVSDFLEKIVADKLIFTSITVGDELNAFKVFETLNARGVKLSTGDLVKNYLFSEIAKTSEHDLEEVERQWQKINDNLQKVELPTFLRHYWNSRFTLETKTTLFKAIKSKIIGSKVVFDLLNDLEELSQVYIAFGEPGNDLWNPEQNSYIEQLSLFNVTQCFTVLLPAYKFIKPVNENEFTKILRDLVVIVFRYNTIGQLNANTLEKEFNKSAISISNGRLKSSKEVFESFSKDIYIQDEIFKNNFAYKSINTNRNKKLARYILTKIENQIAERELDWEDSKLTIEHILPENAPDEWAISFDPNYQDDYIYRLGNLTLIERAKNNDCGTKSFAEKSSIYKSSQYKMTNSELEYEEWNPRNLEKRQAKLASIAKSVWKVQY